MGTYGATVVTVYLGHEYHENQSAVKQKSRDKYMNEFFTGESFVILMERSAVQTHLSSLSIFFTVTNAMLLVDLISLFYKFAIVYQETKT